MSKIEKMQIAKPLKLSRLDQKKQTRTELINVALQLSSAQGFASLSIREVTAKAGITAAAFYRHFRSMEDLGLCLVDEVGLSLRHLLRDARLKIAPAGSEPISTSIKTFLDFIQNNSNLFRLLLGEKHGASATFRKAFHAELDRFISELAVDLEQYHKLIKKPLRDPSLTAEAIVAVAFTVGAEAIDLPKHKRRGLAERLEEEIKMILRGSLSREIK